MSGRIKGGKVVTGVATLYTNGHEVSHTIWSLGATATDFDADLSTLVTAINQAQLHLNLHPLPQITIFSTNPAAIQAITNLHPHSGQSFSRDFCTMLTQILSAHRTIKIKLEWCPSATSIEGIKQCIDLAHNNAAAPLALNHREPNTIAFQKASTKERAILAWQAHWHNADRCSQAYLALPAPPQASSPLPSWVLRVALTQPPPPSYASSWATHL